MGKRSRLVAQERIILVRVKIERAKKHLKDFETSAESFKEAYLTVVGLEEDAKTKQAFQYFATLPISRFDILAAAGDVLQNLRSALDHLAFQMVQAAEGRAIGEKRGKRIAFPIFDTAKEYEARKGGKVQGARESAKKAIDALKPYKSGNYSLWLLHYLNNVDKHRHVITIGRDYLLEGVGFPGRYWHKAARPLFRGIFGSEQQENAKFVIKKSAAKAGVGEGQPLLPFLHEMVDFVDNLVTIFEPHLRARKEKLP